MKIKIPTATVALFLLNLNCSCKNEMSGCAIATDEVTPAMKSKKNQIKLRMLPKGISVKTDAIAIIPRSNAPAYAIV